MKGSLALIPIALLFCVAVLAGCGGGGGATTSNVLALSADYYPMTEGSSWTYTWSSEFSTPSGDREVRAVAPKQADGKTAFGIAMWAPPGDYSAGCWAIDYAVSDDEGIRIIGQRNAPDLDSIPDDVFVIAREQLLFPKELHMGAKWTGSYSAQFPDELKHFEVTRVGKAVVTPAGTFQNCIEIRSRAGALPTADEYSIDDYAPGVGLVRHEFHTNAPPPPGGGGWNGVLELISYHIAE